VVAWRISWAALDPHEIERPRRSAPAQSRRAAQIRAMFIGLPRRASVALPLALTVVIPTMVLLAVVRRFQGAVFRSCPAGLHWLFAGMLAFAHRPRAFPAGTIAPRSIYAWLPPPPLTWRRGRARARSPLPDLDKARIEEP
jgi:hypothetical protein